MYSGDGEVAGRKRDGLPELQQRVGEWHRRVFGRDPINGRLAKKLNEEQLEVCDALAEIDMLGADPANVLWPELADVQIVLCAIADRHGIDLQAATEKKFEIVRARGKEQIERDRQRGIEGPLATSLATEEVGK